LYNKADLPYEYFLGRVLKNVLIIDDDEKLIEPLITYFERFNFTLTGVIDPLEGLKRLRNEVFDLVILDVMLPGIDGFEVCRRIRQASDIPVIMLTARGDVMDRVVGLEIGADDYLPKPFEPRELVARIQNILKRSQINSGKQNYRFGSIKIDLNRKQLLIDGSVVEMTASEFALLSLLVTNQQKIFSRDEIMQTLRGIDAELFSRAIDVMVSRLRQKLGRPELIQTVRGIGYQFIDR
jgi:two-component system, OmpR family, response regulator